LKFEKFYFVKNKHNFPKENVGGTNVKDTKKAGKLQKFRQFSLLAVAWRSRSCPVPSLRFYIYRSIL